MNVFGERQHPEKFIPMVIQRVRDDKKVVVHANEAKTKAGSRHYIHAQDVADGLMFILNLKNYSHEGDFGNAKCPKFNLVGPEEIDNLTLAKMIAKAQNKELIYELVDNHSSRPGHDLRYSLSPKLLKKLGWQAKIKLSKRIEEVVNYIEYIKDNPDFLEKGLSVPFNYVEIYKGIFDEMNPSIKSPLGKITSYSFNLHLWNEINYHPDWDCAGGIIELFMDGCKIMARWIDDKADDRGDYYDIINRRVVKPDVFKANICMFVQLIIKQLKTFFIVKYF